MIKYKKAGQEMTIIDVVREINDCLEGCMEGDEVTNVYNDTMMDSIEYIGDSIWRKVNDEYGGGYEAKDKIKEDTNA